MSRGDSSPYYPYWPYFGYSDLGPVQIPPLPQIVGMTDRTTGKVWYLCFDPAVGDRVCLVDTLPPGMVFRAKVYGPYDGPFIEAYGLRMGVDEVGGAPHVVFDTYPGDAAGGPWGFQFTAGNTQTAEILATSLVNLNAFDHLMYELVNLT